MKRAPRSTSGTLTAAALALLAGSAASAESRGMSEVRSVLEKPFQQDTRTQGQVVDQLADLGPDAVPALFDIYMGDGLEELFGKEEAVDVDDWWCRPDEMHEVVLAALGRMSPKDVVAHVDRTVPDDAEHETRVATLRVLAALGSTEALEPLFRLGASFGTLPLRYRSVQSPMETAFEAILVGDTARVVRDLPELLEDAPEGVQSTFVTAAGRTGREELVSVFARLAQGGGDVGVQALETLPDLVNAAPWRHDDSARELARNYLSSADWRYRRAAAFAAGQMNDVEAFRGVVLLLDDDHQAVASAARWALEAISEIEDPETSTAWLRWFDEQEGWWYDNRDALFDDLDSGDAMRVGQALRNLYARPLFREEAAHEVSRLLDSSDEALVVTAINGLQDLGSKRVVPELVWLVDSRSQRIRVAAVQALGRLTGADLPPDRNAWRAYVEG
jgi:HEAT repeat protein